MHSLARLPAAQAHSSCGPPLRRASQRRHRAAGCRPGCGRRRVAVGEGSLCSARGLPRRRGCGLLLPHTNQPTHALLSSSHSMPRHVSVMLGGPQTLHCPPSPSNRPTPPSTPPCTRSSQHIRGTCSPSGSASSRIHLRCRGCFSATPRRWRRRWWMTRQSRCTVLACPSSHVRFEKPQQSIVHATAVLHGLCLLRPLHAWSSQACPVHVADALEECERYEESEALARRALALNPKDAWAAHQVVCPRRCRP